MDLYCLRAYVACLLLPGTTGGQLTVMALEEGVTHAANVGDLFNLLDKTAQMQKRKWIVKSMLKSQWRQSILQNSWRRSYFIINNPAGTSAFDSCFTEHDTMTIALPCSRKLGSTGFDAAIND